jgi:predicted  nucleic acid-binding Zn-ribbon protein
MVRDVLLVICVIFLCVFNPRMVDATADQIQETYKKIADGLLDVCKQHAEARPKIYSILDQINKLSSTAQTLAQNHHNLEKILQEKNHENQALKKELVAIRSDVSNARKSLEVAKIELSKKMEEHKVQAQQLVQERKDLLGKINTLEAGQKDQPDKKRMVKRSDTSLAVGKNTATA